MANTSTDFLLELYSEEIPARMQKRAGEDFIRLFQQKFAENGLSYDAINFYYTPQRNVIHVTGLPIRQADLSEEKKGPPVSAPQPALDGFLKANGLNSLDQCEKRALGKDGTEYYFATLFKKGQETKPLLSQLICSILTEFRWPKSMRWGSNSFTWVRPLHSILAVFNGETIEGSLDLGAQKLVFGNKTNGHRFLAPQTLTVKDFADYKAQLLAHHVILDQAERLKMILDQAHEFAKKHKLVFKEDPALLEEVTGLVEWPFLISGQIDAAFMEIPAEVLVTSMKVHQKYLALFESSGALARDFLVVTNCKASSVNVVKGNEKVLNARLSDAKFFNAQDMKTALSTHAQRLANLTFHDKLGNMAQKSTRLIRISEYLSDLLGLSAQSAALAKAAEFAKADLVTGMVGEFPELQGLMGSYYAIGQGQGSDVALAIRDHYKPVGAGDDCPETALGGVLALADKMDALVGFFAVDLKPTGSKDPFALRRACLGVLRIIQKFKFSFNLAHLVEFVLECYARQGILASKDKNMADLFSFFEDRLTVMLRDQGHRLDFVRAILTGSKIESILSIYDRLEAFDHFFENKDNLLLISLYKRANNILDIEEKKDKASYHGDIDEKCLTLSEESALHNSLILVDKDVKSALTHHDFRSAMGNLKKLSAPVNHFFDKVMVNVEDSKIRKNRLELLGQIRQTMNQIAAFSLIEDK